MDKNKHVCAGLVGVNNVRANINFDSTWSIIYPFFTSKSLQKLTRFNWEKIITKIVFFTSIFQNLNHQKKAIVYYMDL